MTLEKKQINSIISIFDQMADMEIMYFNKFTPDERQWITAMLGRQDGKRGYFMELNSTHEKLRKIIPI